MTPLLIAALVLLPSPAGPREDFSIEEILSSPFPSELTASPAGGRIAWVMNDRGVRNVFVAEAGEPGGTRTSFDKDDGQELHELAWSPDGRLLAFTRGGPPNPRGDAPNPSSEALAPEQAVYLIGPPGTSARLVGEGHSPALSAEGLLAFVRKREVWGAPVEGGAPALLFHCGGQASSVRFSPDGSRLAFVSERGDHSFVGIFDVKAKTLLYLDPSVDRDWEPAWSKDGTRVAFLRTAASITPFTFGPQRTAEPWSIRVADVTTGKGREVFKSDPGTGSHFHGLPIVNQILWGEGDRLVFPWEKTGFLGLFAVSVSGGPAVPLAAGSFEVEFVSLSPDRKTLVFSSNQGDVDRRHIFSVPVAGGPTVPRTEGSGIEWSPVLASDGTTLAYLASEARRPAHPVVLPGAGAARDLAPRRAFVPETALVTPEPVLITSADGRTVHAQLFRPKGLAPRVRVPAVVFFHGGPWRQMLLGWHYRNYYHNAYAMNQYLASRGYIVLSVNYRSGIGYGMEFREALNYGAHGASEFADVLGAGLYLRARPDVDPARVGLWGGSYGGYLTALGLARASDLFAAGVDLHGVHDWNKEIPVFAPGYDPEKQQEMARVAFESSPIAAISTWRSPVLFIHGDDDRNVPFSETVTLAEALRTRGVHVEQLVLPDEVHEFLVHGDWVRAYTAAVDFFDRHLKAAPKAASEDRARP